MSPADCVVILIGGAGFDKDGAMGAAVVSLLEAAEWQDVPALALAHEREDLACGYCPALSFESPNPLADPDVWRVFTDMHRPRLIIGGEPAETVLTFTVLSALEEGFDVCLLRDLCCGVTEMLADTAAARMVQAGAVPVTVPQVIAEWRCAMNERHERHRINCHRDPSKVPNP